MRENYNKKTYCLVCNKEVDLIVKNIKKHYKDDIIDIEYDGKTVVCPICGDEQYDDEIIRYNQEQIDKKYKEECDIISKEDIEKILEKYNLKTNITTNGTLVKEKLDIIKNSKD